MRQVVSGIARSRAGSQAVNQAGGRIQHNEAVPTSCMHQNYKSRPPLPLLRPGIVGMRGSMVILLRPCMISSTPPAHPPVPCLRTIHPRQTRLSLRAYNATLYILQTTTTVRHCMARHRTAPHGTAQAPSVPVPSRPASLRAVPHHPLHDGGLASDASYRIALNAP